MKHAIDFIMAHLDFMEMQMNQTPKEFPPLLFHEREQLKTIIEKCSYLLNVNEYKLSRKE